jgi:hypothetical protein
MIKAAIISLLLLPCAGMWAQGNFEASAPKGAQQGAPKGVVDLFLSCPYIGIDDKVPQDRQADVTYSFGSFSYSDKGGMGSAKQQRLKRLMLQGIPLDSHDPIAALVVDEKDGYLHIAMADGDDLVLVYYKHPDNTLIPAFRLDMAGGQFDEPTWGFFDVKNGAWLRIPDEQILPSDKLDAFFPHGASAKDALMSSVAGWDIVLPQFGTTALLIPRPYESDLDDPNRAINLPRSSQKVTQGEVWDWFGKNMSSSGKTKSLELKWNKAAGHFESGQLRLRDAAPPDQAPARTIQDVVEDPQNVWEDFLSCPALYNHEGTLTFDPWAGLKAKLDDRVYWLGAKELLLVDRHDDPTESVQKLDISVPQGHLSLVLAYKGEGGALSGTTRLEMLSKRKADSSDYLVLRYFGVDGTSSSSGSFLANFYKVRDGIWEEADPSALISTDQVDAFALPGSSQKDALILSDTAWDLNISPDAGTIDLVPSGLNQDEGGPYAAVVKTFGSEGAANDAYAAFEKKYFDYKALELVWDGKLELFARPGLVSLDARSPH